MVAAGAVAQDPTANFGTHVAAVLAQLPSEDADLHARRVERAVPRRLALLDGAAHILGGSSVEARPALTDEFGRVRVAVADGRQSDLRREGHDRAMTEAAEKGRVEHLEG